ncbi:MAG: helix-turn-helix domain-containing protein [Thermoanaerobaculia bacterium]
MTPKELRSTRIRLHWSIPELAGQLRVPASLLERWERGEVQIPSDEEARIERLISDVDRSRQARALPRPEARP